MTTTELGAVTAALDRSARLGPYFVLEAGPPPGPGWRPAADLCDPAVLGPLVDGHAGRLGTAERRVATSVLFQGHAARLWSVVLGPLAADGVVPDLDPRVLCWRDEPGAGRRLRLPTLAGRRAPGDPGGAAALLEETVVDAHLVPLVGAVGRLVRLPAGLLWGNAASALAGTLGVIEQAAPGPAARVRPAVLRLLDLGPLRGAGTVSVQAAGAAVRTRFRRRSCCLFDRVPGGGRCGDCCRRR